MISVPLVVPIIGSNHLEGKIPTFLSACECPVIKTSYVGMDVPNKGPVLLVCNFQLEPTSHTTYQLTKCEGLGSP